MRVILKRTLNRIALVLVAIPALTCRLFHDGSGGGVFAFWVQIFALLPGVPGMFLRRAFYRWVLDGCPEDVTIEFGAIINRPGTVLESGVYIGSFALVGWCRIGEGTLVGSRVSILSGGAQHSMSESGRWTLATADRLKQVVLGRNTWVGEGAILMADIGAGCMVAAGAVVSSAIPDGVMVAGNPARFVKYVTPERLAPDADAVKISAVR